ncbi:MAG: alcohol dehydrogenase catalytic domain-containing protein [Desulfobacterota bacterium]|jgi:threonine dehydrogenase-like Zn-dependent dehydrogenase|nr:alcohol dehydrogenase catalytic domain-containing protein [Thermodesulfobacteriota bacterium]
MKGLMFNYSLPRIALKKVGLGGDFFLVKYSETWPVPKIFHPNQVLVKTRLAGICASDLHQMTVSMSLYPSIMASPVNPVPMGHEVVGTIAEVGSAVSGLRPGDRVVYNPVARCSFFGFRPCPSCLQGNYQHCFCLLGIGDGTDRERECGGRRRFGGFGGGGFSENLLGYEKQFHLVPDHVPDDVAVLAEPFTIALHAVARHMPRHDDTVVVVGAGIIGLLTIKALRALGSRCRIISLARYPMQVEMAIKLGATEVISERDMKKLYDRVAGATGGSLFAPLLSKQVLYGNKGPDIIYDSVASESSVEDDLRLVRSNGKVVLTGLDFHITRKVDWSLVVWKEIEVTGTLFSGKEPIEENELDAFDMALKLMASDPCGFSGLVTNTFPIERYREAVQCFRSKKATNAIKVVLDFRGVS